MTISDPWYELRRLSGAVLDRAPNRSVAVRRAHELSQNTRLRCATVDVWHEGEQLVRYRQGRKR